MNTTQVIKMLDADLSINDMLFETMREGYSFEEAHDVLVVELGKAVNLTRQLLEGIKDDKNSD